MPRSGVIGTYSLPPNTNNQAPNTPISSSMFNSFASDVQQTFNDPTPVAYGGTGAATAAAAATALEVVSYAAQVLTPAQQGQALANIGAGVLSGFRNKIINGDFVVNQRGGTKTPGVGVYGYDRWKGHANGLEQVIEALEPGEYTLTWGGGGSGTFAGTTATSPLKATSAGGNVSVVVPSTATRVSLVPGDATAEADPFSPRHIQQELALCQRYYYKHVVPGFPRVIAVVVNQDYAGASLSHYLPCPVTMRTVPTITPAYDASLPPTIVAGKEGAAYTWNPTAANQYFYVLSGTIFDAEM